MFGRLGQGLSQGLVDTVPKEVERYRMGQHLQNLGNQQDLTPFQRFSGLLTTPGMTPQGIQSGERLLSNEARAKAFNQASQPIEAPPPMPPMEKRGGGNGKSPTTEKPSVFQKVQEGYSSPSLEEREQEATQEYHKNPARYGNDFQNALDRTNSKYAQEEKNYENAVKQHGIFTKLQDSIKGRLSRQKELLKADNIDADAYKSIENKSIKAVLPVSEGGLGMTEQQAIDKYGDELKVLAREAKQLDSIDDSNILFDRPSEINRNISSAQKSAKSRLDENPTVLQDFANKLIAKNLSPIEAYSKAMPVSDYPKVNAIVKALPDQWKRQYTPTGEMDAIEKLAPLLASTGASVLSIAKEFEGKGYNPSKWLKYVSDNQETLNLNAIQKDELQTRNPAFRSLNDWWLDTFTGSK